MFLQDDHRNLACPDPTLASILHHHQILVTGQEFTVISSPFFSDFDLLGLGQNKLVTTIIETTNKNQHMTCSKVHTRTWMI
jgi:hypothetical protein